MERESIQSIVLAHKQQKDELDVLHEYMIPNSQNTFGPLHTKSTNKGVNTF